MENLSRVPGDACRYRNIMIRFLLVFVVLSLNGCHRTVVDREIVVSPDGQSRLLLRYNTRDNKGFDFNDLVLETQSGIDWEYDSTIWSGDAHVAPGVKRWVSSLDSLGDDRQTAIIKIATMGPRDAVGKSTVEYSWVRWDLAANAKIQTLHVCDSPFDALPPDKR
ncbi:hypothetical protein [Rubripirellula reticaptiva]|uniref:Uncharacterized protein n=1 Tax=Rubripirellula reticaptiva TaxID=2528013 RepID=A0A5C6EVH5_9BACT|nr:hypothetical protein [Rubripirellula reticaptiva]TWU51489.1 hypothetical protein Poly59_30810 [Rubripirellula reticaptiva]